ncbi:MAG TPA: enoyl-CoA hydratase-related protein [Acidimicrobiia bacterium]|jgi:enoyl-CoA hydratase
MALRKERHERVLVLVLDDPQRRNALSRELVGDIVDACDQAEADPDVGALVVTGAPPAFCSGADVSSLAALGTAGDGDAGDRDGESSGSGGALLGIYEGFLRVHRSRLPTVAAVNGPAVGAGFNLALACDVRVAGESGRFDARFLSLGLHPGGGHTWLLERAVGPQAAAAMVLFGEAIGGRRAEQIGLAWSCVPDDELLTRAIELATRAAAVPVELAATAKATLRRAPWVSSFDDAVAGELEAQVWSATQGFFAERMAARRRERS